MRKKSFVVSDESINTYGMRVLNDGVKFPPHVPAFYEHDTESDPIGHWTNFRREDNKWVGDLNYNDITPRGKEICDMIDAGHIGQASVGIDMRSSKLSRAKKHLIEGQTRPTFTEAFVPEISAVKLAANRSAIALYDGGIDKRMNLSDCDDTAIPFLDNNGINNENENTSMTDIFKTLNLSDTATQTDAVNEIDKLKAELEAAKKRLHEIKAEQSLQLKDKVKNLLDTAISDKRIGETERISFEKLFDADFDNTKMILDARTATLKLSDIPSANKNHSEDGKVKFEGMSFSELSRKKSDVLMILKNTNPAMFKALYKSEYGKDYKE